MGQGGALPPLKILLWLLNSVKARMSMELSVIWAHSYLSKPNFTPWQQRYLLSRNVLPCAFALAVSSAYAVSPIPTTMTHTLPPSSTFSNITFSMKPDLPVENDKHTLPNSQKCQIPFHSFLLFPTALIILTFHLLNLFIVCFLSSLSLEYKLY